MNPSPPFLGLVAAACGGSVLSEQIAKNEKEYEAPHPESAKVVPASEAVTEQARGKSQSIGGVKVRGEVDDQDLIHAENTLGKVYIKDDIPNGAMESLSH